MSETKPFPEPTLTDTERRAFWQAMCEWNDLDDGFGRDMPSNAALYAAVERIKAEAVDRERAAWATKVEALADSIQLTYDAGPDAYTHGALRQLHHTTAHELRGLLAAGDTEGKP